MERPSAGFRVVGIGDVVGRYELVEELGEGGMATVYRARDRELRREVAVKILFPHLARRAEVVARFQREARAAAGLEHANILRVYDVGGGDAERGGDPPYIVMELVRGGTLRETVEAHGAMLAELAACVGALLADALAVAHGAGVVHRDVKPANVMVAPGGRLLLTDFGVAHVQDDDSLVTRTGALLGTPAFMSPEQATGAAVDPRTDVYSLGATLYQLSTGHLPYTGPAARVVSAIAAGELVPPIRRRPAVGDELSRLIERMMATELERRPASAAEAATELRRLVAEAGLGDPADELTAYFADPDATTARLAGAVAARLVARARAARDEGKVARAIALCDRASALAPDDREVATLVGELSAPRRRGWVVWAGVGTIAVAGAAVVTWQLAGRGGAMATTDAVALAPPADAAAVVAIATVDAAPAPIAIADAAPVIADAAAPRRRDARIAARSIDASVAAAIDAAAVVKRDIDAAPATGKLLIKTGGRWCDLTIDGKKRDRVIGPPVTLELSPGEHAVKCTQPAGAFSERVTIVAGQTVTLERKLVGKVEVRNAASRRVTIDGVTYAPGDAVMLEPGRHQIDGKWVNIRTACSVRESGDCL